MRRLMGIRRTLRDPNPPRKAFKATDREAPNGGSSSTLVGTGICRGVRRARHSGRVIYNPIKR